MCKLWVGKVYGSSLAKGKAGVLILIHKNFPCEVVSTVNDTEGRLLTLQLRVTSKEQIVTNVYAPNFPTKYFFQSVSTHLAPFLHLPLVLGGDFNSVMEPQEDKSIAKPQPHPPTNYPPTALSSFAAALQLIDPWCLAHPEGKEFTFYLPPHHALSRIDYFLINAAILTLTSDIIIHKIAISGLAPISAQIRDLGPLPPNENVAFPTIFGPQFWSTKCTTRDMVGIWTDERSAQQRSQSVLGHRQSSSVKAGF